jgi:hypothetical protein
VDRAWSSRSRRSAQSGGKVIAAKREGNIIVHDAEGFIDTFDLGTLRSFLEEAKALREENREKGLGPPRPLTDDDPIIVHCDLPDDMPCPVITDESGEHFVDLSPIFGSEIGLMHLVGPPHNAQGRKRKIFCRPRY